MIRVLPIQMELNNKQTCCTMLFLLNEVLQHLERIARFKWQCSAWEACEGEISCSVSHFHLVFSTAVCNKNTSLRVYRKISRTLHELLPPRTDSILSYGYPLPIYLLVTNVVIEFARRWECNDSHVLNSARTLGERRIAEIHFHSRSLPKRDRTRPPRTKNVFYLKYEIRKKFYLFFFFSEKNAGMSFPVALGNTLQIKYNSMHVRDWKRRLTIFRTDRQVNCPNSGACYFFPHTFIFASVNKTIEQEQNLSRMAWKYILTFGSK